MSICPFTKAKSVPKGLCRKSIDSSWLPNPKRQEAPSPEEPAKPLHGKAGLVGVHRLELWTR